MHQAGWASLRGGRGALVGGYDFCQIISFSLSSKAKIKHSLHLDMQNSNAWCIRALILVTGFTWLSSQWNIFSTTELTEESAECFLCRAMYVPVNSETEVVSDGYSSQWNESLILMHSELPLWSLAHLKKKNSILNSFLFHEAKRSESQPCCLWSVLKYEKTVTELLLLLYL